MEIIIVPGTPVVENIILTVDFSPHGKPCGVFCLDFSNTLRKSPIRYSGNRLKKRVTVKGMVDFGEGNEGRNRESALGIFDSFWSKKKNMENAKNMDEMMCEAVKNRCGYYEKG